MDTSDAPPAVDANAAGFLAPSDLAAAKAQVISKSGKRGWLDWRKCDWDRWGAAPRATAPLEVSEGRAFVLAKVPLKGEIRRGVRRRSTHPYAAHVDRKDTGEETSIKLRRRRDVTTAGRFS